MTLTLPHSILKRCLTLVGAVCLGLILGAFLEVKSQCPIGGGARWAPGTNVPYLIHPSITDANQKNQIRSAMNKWTAENQINGSNVSFQETFVGTATPPQLTYTSGINETTLADGSTVFAPAFTEKQLNPDGTINTATITIDAHIRAGIDTTPGSPGLSTIFEKLALHETGHTMGEGHVQGGQTARNPRLIDAARSICRQRPLPQAL